MASSIWFQNKSKQEIVATKDKTKEPEGTIKVMLKGQKEVLTLTKVPEDAVISTYKPDIKPKEDKSIKAGKTVKGEAVTKSDKKADAEGNESSASVKVNNLQTQKANDIDSKVSLNSFYWQP